MIVYIFILAFTLILVPITLFTTGPARIILGLLFILFIPGYTLTIALFTKKGSLDVIERTALSFGLSIAVISLLALALNYTSWGIRLDPIVIGIAIIVLIALCISLYKHFNLPKDQRFEPHFHINISKFREQNRLYIALLCMLLIAVIVSIGLLAFIITTPIAEEGFTKFYIREPELDEEGISQELVLVENRIIIGIVNFENKATIYSIEIENDSEIVQEIGPISLNHRGQWEETIILSPSEFNVDQIFEFLLYREYYSGPYHSLLLQLHAIETP